MRIAIKAASTLQHSEIVDIESFAFCSAHECRDRLMPAFAADPETEMRIVEKNPPVTGVLSHKQVNYLVYSSRIAAQATLNITNQLVYGRMHGLR